MGRFVWIAIIGSIAAILIAVGRVKPTDDVDPPRTGPAKMRLEALCAESELVEAEILSAQGRRDEAAVKGLFDRNQVANLGAGADVNRVFEHGILTNVRIESGYNTGEYCWVPNAALP